MAPKLLDALLDRRLSVVRDEGRRSLSEMAMHGQFVAAGGRWTTGLVLPARTAAARDASAAAARATRVFRS
jgi:hypothetical protein